MINLADSLPWIGRILSALSRISGYVIAYFKGRGDERAKSTEETLEAIRKAQEVVDSLATDPEFLDRVREHYRRR